MSKTRNYMPQTIEVIKRFNKALVFCLNSKLTTMTYFSNTYGISREGLYRQMEDYNRGYFEVGWLIALSQECDISLNWMLTGKGGMLLN